MYCSHTDKSFLVPEILTYISLCAIFTMTIANHMDTATKRAYTTICKAFLCYEIFNIQRLYKGRT